MELFSIRIQRTFQLVSTIQSKDKQKKADNQQFSACFIRHRFISIS